MTAADAEGGFGEKDMLILLDKKIDKVLDLMSGKADASEVLKLRDRMHKVEGGIATFGWITEALSSTKTDVKVLEEKVDHLETTQITEEKVAAALAKHQEKQRGTFRWAVGVLASLGVVNLVIQAAQALQGGAP